MIQKDIIKSTSSIALDSNGNLKSIHEQYLDYISGKFTSHDFMVLKENSKGFNYFDINEDLILIMRQSVIEKILRLPSNEKHGHFDSVDFNLIQQLIEHPEKILYAIKNTNGTYCFIFDIMSKNNEYILLALNSSRNTGRGFEVNDVSSIYGKNNLEEYLSYCLKNNYLIKKCPLSKI